MTRIAIDHIHRALAALDAGFATKAARQDALGELSRAYDLLRESVNKLCLDDFQVAYALGTARPAGAEELYAALPFSLAHFRAKHGALAVKVYPKLADEIVPQIDRIFDLRQSILAAPITPKAKLDKSAPEVLATATRTQVRGICQCCGREQAVVSGTMSKHGYTVEHGWFNGVCSGERYAPMQVSRTKADAIVAEVRAEVISLQKHALALHAGQELPEMVAKPNEYVKRGQKRTMVPLASLSTYVQHQIINGLAAQAEARARMGAAFAHDLEALANHFYGTELKTVKVA